MLNEMYRIDASEKLQMLSIINSVNMSGEGRSNLYRIYEDQQRDLLDIDTSIDDDYSGLDILEQWLG
jgi:hypothetical protein